jgi:hypothetical protein
MRKALLQRVVTETAAGSGSPIGRFECASSITTPSTLPADCAESPPSAAHDQPRSSDVVDEALSTSPSSAAEANPARPHEIDPEVHGPQADLDGGLCVCTAGSRRPDDSGTGSAAATESAAAPAAAELAADALQNRPAKMFVAGSGAVLESGEGAAA